MSEIKVKVISIALSVLVAVGVVRGVKVAHDNTEREFVLSGGQIYSWIYYECIGGVMYRLSRSSTLLVDANGKPKSCETLIMTNGEFYEIIERNKK